MIFSRKKTKDLDLSGLVTDMHSHLLPGIDDGSPDTATSDELINGLLSLGYKKLITTPHVMTELYPNTPETIGSAYKKLREQTTLSQLGFPVTYAAEYMLDENFDQLVSDKKLLCLSENLVLVEFSFIAAPPNFKNKFFELQIHHYTPVLAHPERYLYLLSDKMMYENLRAAGCLFAVNLLSFTGYYGRPAADMANYLLKKNYIDLLGTDLHHVRHLDTLRRASQLGDVVQSLLDSGNLINPRL